MITPAAHFKALITELQKNQRLTYKAMTGAKHAVDAKRHSEALSRINAKLEAYQHALRVVQGKEPEVMA